MPVLALDSATGACSATIVAGGEVIASRLAVTDRGQASLLPEMVQDCLRQAGIAARDLALVAVTVGPGSFTGIRGAAALAQGIALSAGIPVTGVTVGEAIADALPRLGARRLWIATPSRRGRIFLEHDGRIDSLAVTDLPSSGGPVALAGTAAADIASRLAARGENVLLTDALFPSGRHIAVVAERRMRGELPPLAAEPLYVDPPAVRPNQPIPGDNGG